MARPLTILGRGFGPGANVEVRRGPYTVSTQAGPGGDTAAQFDRTRRYSPTARPRVTGTTTVTLVPRRPR